LENVVWCETQDSSQHVDTGYG